MTTRLVCALATVSAAVIVVLAQPAASQDDMRMPWKRSNERFIRNWLALTDVPLGAQSFEADLLADQGGETNVHPIDKAPVKLAGGTAIQWRALTAWGDAVDLSDGKGVKRDVAGYASTKVSRKEAGKALLCIGSDESIRVWVNGSIVLDKRGPRQLTFDEDQVEVDLNAGENALLVKVEQRSGPWVFSARVLERGAVPLRIQEIGPSIVQSADEAVTIRTDISKDRAGQDRVNVQAVAAGGRVLGEKIAPRGESITFDTRAWADGPYEFRFSTRRLNGLQYTTHLPWFKGDSVTAAKNLVASAAKADPTTSLGSITKMLGQLVTDRLGNDLGAVTGNPWWPIHSALMEYDEVRMESAGEPARVRPHGFVRLAYRDEVDGSTQFCRTYLPGGYTSAKKWPLVIRLHGYNPANPDYVRWWSVDTRHMVADAEYSGREGVIFMEPHGRGNTTYLGLGDQDVLRTIELAKKQFSVDEDRIYLIGESMGGWGTWNVATRHPDLFAAIVPVYGGADYHSQLKPEEIAKLSVLDRYLQEKQSSWAMAEGLLHTPILVYHGDVDRAVNVDYSRWGVRLLQRWGYNVRYIELPGYAHEDLNITAEAVEWLLQHKRVAAPARVRLRSAELRHAAAHWVSVEQFAKPNDFMVVDAEITAPNTIRVDSQNVLALTLAPPASLVDPSKPVNVSWNGDKRVVKAHDGRLRLDAPGYDRSGVEKNKKIAGPISDVLNTPFAIVTGTSGSDAAMKEICARKSEALVRFWSDWQRQPPRVFKDVDLKDEDAARYSLILIGGPEVNSVTRRLSGKIPVDVSAKGVTLGKRRFESSNARVTAIYPSPLNAERYVLLVASGSAEGLYFWRPDRLRGAEMDFVIEDDRMPAGAERLSAADLWVAGGWFNRRWEVEEGLTYAGNPERRAKAIVLRAPKPGQSLDRSTGDSYLGSYHIAPGVVVKVQWNGNRLMADSGQEPPVELVPVSDTEFVVVEGPLKIVFEKDTSGKVVGFKAWRDGREMSAKRVLD